MQGPIVDRADVGRVLIVKLTSLGDVIHGTAAIRPLRRVFPNAEITWVVDERFADVPRHHPEVTRVIGAKRLKGTPLRELKEIGDAAVSLRREGVDLAIDLQGTLRSALWTYASGAPAMAGRGRPRPGWRRTVSPDLNRHAVRVIADIMAALGMPDDDPEPALHWPKSCEESVSALLAERGIADQPFAVFNPFSRWRSKEWPMDRFGELARCFSGECGAPIVVIGGAAESARAMNFADAVRPAQVIPVAGLTDLPALFCLLKRARMVVSVDSGPMHAAAAVGTRVVALFGPTMAHRTGPWGNGHVVLQKLEPKSHHAYRRDDGTLMAMLRVDMVCDAVLRAWRGENRSSG